ncbi:HNH endonuclease [Rubripirellula sp.]|nr:HNH endonuclease [Rubripirellula sp.]MDB4634526.1 HNH endonuclease [Rubripirellula sp.]
MAIKWELDQGRESYWRFQSILEIATALQSLEFKDLYGRTRDPLSGLRKATNLPFKTPLSRDYTIWRQYSRVFRSALLATEIDGQLVLTDLCKKLSSSKTPMTSDEYLAILMRRFYSPPFFGSTYKINARRVFPGCVLMRYLIANYKSRKGGKIGFDAIFSTLIGNDCVGNESTKFYRKLQPTGYKPNSNHEKRRVREMVKVFGQFSLLHWDGTELHFSVNDESKHSLETLFEFFAPFEQTQKPDRDAETISLGSIDSLVLGNESILERVSAYSDADANFIEGKRRRVTHLSVERNPRLRMNYLKHLLRKSEGVRCDVCNLYGKERYPWLENLFDVHHLLPLASAAIVKTAGTSFDDLVPLCPNCHRSVHMFYSSWLKDNSKDDFSSKEEALSVYRGAKEGFINGM